MDAETRWLIRFNRQVMDRRNNGWNYAAVAIERKWCAQFLVRHNRYYQPATNFRIQPVETSTNLLGNLD